MTTCSYEVKIQITDESITPALLPQGTVHVLATVAGAAGTEVSGSERVLVVDGGLATELERRGHSIADDPLWSARLLYSDPQAILDVHKSYLESGADVIITASYQASVDGFRRELGVTENEALDLIGRSVTIAKQAREQYTPRKGVREAGLPLIAGSVGPYGACQHDGSEYTGNYVDHMTKEELMEWHRPRVSALVASGVDMLACETLPALTESQAVVDLLMTEFPHTKAWVSFSCQNGTQTCHGEEFSEAVATILDRSAVVEGERRRGREQIVAVGVNCSNPNYVESLLKSASCASDCVFVAYPNSGETWNTEQHKWSGAVVDISEEAEKWIQLGARFVGGCCRIGPEDIHSLRLTVDHYNKKLTHTLST